MHRVSATDAKNQFAAMLSLAANGAVQIEKHGKVVALMVPPDSRFNELDERRVALARQEAVESARLVHHQKIAIELLSVPPAQARRRIREALQVVGRWEAEGLCSEDFVLAWRKLLNLPIRELAQKMCGDLEGWGRALRQNSPWGAER